MKGLTKEHLCTALAHVQQYGSWLGKGEDGAGRRWGKGEKVGAIITAYTIKIKFKEKEFRLQFESYLTSLKLKLPICKITLCMVFVRIEGNNTYKSA